MIVIALLAGTWIAEFTGPFAWDACQGFVASLPHAECKTYIWKEGSFREE